MEVIPQETNMKLPPQEYSMDQLYLSKNCLKLEIDSLKKQDIIQKIDHVSQIVGDTEVEDAIISPLWGDSTYRSVFGGDGF